MNSSDQEKSATMNQPLLQNDQDQSLRYEYSLTEPYNADQEETSLRMKSEIFSKINFTQNKIEYTTMELKRRIREIDDSLFRVPQSEIENLISQLQMMGLEYEVALFALKQNEYSLERSIGFIYDTDNFGMFQHPYISFGNICAICQMDKDNHYDNDHNSNYTSSEPSVDDELGALSFQHIKKVIASQYKIRHSDPNQYFCNICYSNYDKKDAYVFECGHTFCMTCTKQNFQFHIERASLNKLQCFEGKCGKPAQETSILELFKDNEKIIEKIKKFKWRAELDKNPLVRWCTKPGCEGYVKAKSFNVSKVQCPTCNQAICFKCRDDWHGWFTSCQTAQDRKFKHWAKGKISISYCPKCKTKVEKVEGCNHMTCYICKFQWCWICGGTYTDDHYVPLNPFGCGNQQFAEKHPWYIQMWIQFGWFLLAIILLPFAIVFACPFILIGITFDGPLRSWRYDICGSIWNFFKFSMMCILLFTLGMILNIIAIPLFIVFGIPIIIVFMIYKRVQVHRTSNQYLKDIMKGDTKMYNYY